MAMLVCSRNPQEEHLENEQEEAGKQQAPLREQTFFERLRTNGSRRTVQTVSTRYDDHIPWKDRTPEQKLGAVIGGFLLAASMSYSNTGIDTY